MAHTPIKRLLAANRGEIACRIFRTCRRLGIQTVAIYSEADSTSLHVRSADSAFYVGPPEAAQSYLNAEAIVAAAKSAGADAIHPGYGFLSENAAFAETVQREGLLFVGPSPESMRSLGDKLRAKALAARVGVPMAPSLELRPGDASSEAELNAFIKLHGFPVIVKAAGGGGGRGMRKVYREADLADAVTAASREAEKFFRDGRVFVERLIENARHVEVQILGDSFGTVLAIGERDCSYQRRHQKVVEEAPAPHLPEATRTLLHESAARLGREAKYCNAGTVEFLVDRSGGAYFLEVNSRLQVEHPVTEAVTGLDLVELQLRVAEGASLDALLPGGVPPAQGAAIECRICAEDPAKNFVASVGRIGTFDLASDDPGTRVDSGFGAGDCVSRYYDSLVAKLIVTAPSRDEAITAAINRLRAVRISGVKHNSAFIAELLSRSEFTNAAHHIGTIDEFPPPADATDRLNAGAFFLIHEALSNSVPHSLAGFRIDSSAVTTHRLRIDEQESEFLLRAQGDAGIFISCGNFSVEHTVHGEPLPCAVERHGESSWILWDGKAYSVQRARPRPAVGGSRLSGGAVASPLPGRVLEVKTKEGAMVKEGDILLVIESMKMEHLIRAPKDGQVRKILAKAGSVVESGTTLLELE